MAKYLGSPDQDFSVTSQKELMLIKDYAEPCLPSFTFIYRLFIKFVSEHMAYFLPLDFIRTTTRYAVHIVSKVMGNCFQE